MKIGPLDPEIICLKVYLKKTRFIKLWSYWIESHQIFKQCSQIITDEYFEIAVAILDSFWNAKAMNGGGSADFAHFDSKIGCHRQRPLDRS